MKRSGVERLLLETLQALWNMEKRAADTFSELATAVSSPKLHGLLEDESSQASAHSIWVEDLFQVLGEEPRGATHEGFEGLLCEGAVLARGQREQPYRDLAIIQIAQVTHQYELALYSSAAAMANASHLTEVVERLVTIVIQKSTAIHSLHGLLEELAYQAAQSRRRRSGLCLQQKK
jgi:ferritin-like metal-binding protein YciE